MSGNPVYPKAVQRITGIDGGSYIGGPPRGVWHETITTPAEFYRSATYYHIQFRQWPLTSKPQIEQAIPFDRASRGLRNLTVAQRVDAGLSAEDVQTNRMGDVNINAALTGYQEDRTSTGGYPSLYPLTDAMVNELCEFMVWCEEEWGVPANVSALIGEPGQQEYGYHSPWRLDNEEWEDFSIGWIGHERVTENTHHDPLWKLKAQLEAGLNLTGGAIMGHPAASLSEFTSEHQWAGAAPAWVTSAWDEYRGAGGSTVAESFRWAAHRGDVAWLYQKFIKPLTDHVEELENRIAALEVAGSTAGKDQALRTHLRNSPP